MKTLQATRAKSKPGFSLIELLAVVAILAVLALIALANFRPANDSAKKRACYVTKGEINLQVRLWYRDKGTWPMSNLSDIGGNTTYFPSGLPTCPADGSAYTIDSTTHQVIGHTH
jgi:prepilin-type N-terminal cleavage/methylation domain-containing protein